MQIGIMESEVRTGFCVSLCNSVVLPWDTPLHPTGACLGLRNLFEALDGFKVATMRVLEGLLQLLRLLVWELTPELSELY